jgi:serine protease Do
VRDHRRLLHFDHAEVPRVNSRFQRLVAHAAAVLALILFAVPATAQEKEWSLPTLSSEIRELTGKVSPAVVQIYTSSFGALMGSVPQGAAVFGSQQATGSGVIIDADGYILTNHHVVAGARRVQVRLSPATVGAEAGESILRSGGAMVGAQVLGVDEETDLAVLKINRKDLPTLPLGDSEEVFQGQLVFAFGSPLGLTGSVSFGIVSTVARQLDRDNPMIYIQSDVAVNPGNSGGPLVNAAGEVVGINTLIMSQSGGSEGLSFSVPSNIARSIYNQIRAHGRVRRGIIGVNPQTVNPWIADGLQLPVQWGVILGDVHPGGPAEKAGLKVGDVVVALDGKKMENARQFRVNLYGKPIGGKVMVEVLREGRSITKQVEVIERVDPDFRFFEMISNERNLVPRLGILALDLDNDARRLLPMEPRMQSGVIVAALAVDTSLLGEQFEPGDIVYAMNGQPLKGLKDLKEKVKAMTYGQVAVFQLERGGQLRYLMLEVE